MNSTGTDAIMDFMDSILKATNSTSCRCMGQSHDNDICNAGCSKKKIKIRREIFTRTATPKVANSIKSNKLFSYVRGKVIYMMYIYIYENCRLESGHIHPSSPAIRLHM